MTVQIYIKEQVPNRLFQFLFQLEVELKIMKKLEKPDILSICIILV